MRKSRFSLFLAILPVILTLVLGGCKSSSRDTIPTPPGLEVSLSAGSPADQDVAANASVVAAHIQLSAITRNDVSITSITLTAFGSGDDLVDITSVDIYLDANDNDAYDAGTDALLGSGAFDANNGRATVNFGSPQIVSSGVDRVWFVMYNLNGNGPDGATYYFRIANPGDVTVSFISGRSTSTRGTPLESSILTITSGGAKLNLLAGLNPPADREVIKGRANIPVLQFRLYNRDSGNVTVTSVRVTPSGSGNDSTGISQGYVCIDANNSGTSNSGDTIFGAFTYPGNDTAADAAGNCVIAAGSVRNFLVVYDVSTGALVGDTYTASIAALAHIQAEDAGATPVTPTGTVPQDGAVITIAEKGSLTAQLGAANPYGRSVIAGATNVPILQIELEAGDLETVTISSMTVRATGSANDTTELGDVKLYEDADGDGSVDTGEILLATTQYASDNGTVVLDSFSIDIVAGSTRNFLVTCNIEAGAQMGSTLGAYVESTSDILAQGLDSGLPIWASGTFPIEGELFEIRVPDSFYAADSLNSARFLHTQTTFTDPNDGKAKVLVCGGSNGTAVLNTAEVYDPALDTWTTVTATMNKARAGHTATLLADGQRILIAGGGDGVLPTYENGEIFDPADYSFTAISDIMAAARELHTAVLTEQGEVFLYGGMDFPSDAFVDVTEAYKESVNRFDRIGTSQFMRVLHTMNRLSTGVIVVAGGIGRSSSRPTGSVLLTKVQVWSTSPSIFEGSFTQQLALPGRCGHAGVVLSGGRLLIAGGYNLDLFVHATPPFSGRKVAELITDPGPPVSNETLKDVGAMSFVRFLPVGELLPSGKALIAGGTDESGVALDSAELYDPAAETFSNSTGTMVQARHRATSSMIPGPDGQLGTSDDMVLIVGGLDIYISSPGPSDVVNSAEIYVP